MLFSRGFLEGGDLLEDLLSNFDDRQVKKEGVDTNNTSNKRKHHSGVTYRLHLILSKDYCNFPTREITTLNLGYLVIIKCLVIMFNFKYPVSLDKDYISPAFCD